jgi:hypothetical protein
MASSLTYPIVRSDSDQITFARKADGCMTTLFIVGGGAVALYGFFRLSVTEELSWIIGHSLLFLFGVAFASASFLLPMIQNEHTPQSITFHHASKTVSIRMGNDEEASFPYFDVGAFEIVSEKRSPSASNSAGIHYIHYHVIVTRKNGGTWFITSTTNQNEAEQVVGMLRDSLKGENGFVQSPSPKLPPFFNIENGNPILISWTNPTPTWIIVGIRLVGAAVLAVLLRILLDIGDQSLTTSAIFIVLVSIFLIPFWLLATRLKRQGSTRYSLSIGTEALQYCEKDVVSAKVKAQKDVPLSSIERIAYSYSGMDKASNSSLMIKAKSSDDKHVHLFLSGLNPVECLQLEMWLQELILKKGSVRVL